MTMQDGMNLGSDSPDKLIGYPISIPRFLVYMIFSFGFYETVWAYKHYRYFYDKPGVGQVISSVIFALFLPLSFFGLMDFYNKKSIRLEHALGLKKLFLGVLFFCLTALCRVVDRFEEFAVGAIICGMVSVVPLIVFQRRVNELNRVLRPDLPFAPPMTVWKWVGLVLGFFVLLGLFIGFALLAELAKGKP